MHFTFPEIIIFCRDNFFNITFPSSLFLKTCNFYQTYNKKSNSFFWKLKHVLLSKVHDFLRRNFLKQLFSPLWFIALAGYKYLEICTKFTTFWLVKLSEMVKPYHTRACVIELLPSKGIKHLIITCYWLFHGLLNLLRVDEYV